MSEKEVFTSISEVVQWAEESIQVTIKMHAECDYWKERPQLCEGHIHAMIGLLNRTSPKTASKYYGLTKKLGLTKE